MTNIKTENKSTWPTQVQTEEGQSCKESEAKFPNRTHRQRVELRLRDYHPKSLKHPA